MLVENKEAPIIRKIDYSLYELLKKYKVCIPVIQRDYIQGLDEESIKSKRQRMIDDIIDGLQSKKGLSLNIVYGLHEDESSTFYPVDGQQRLTLLYLLHWYLAIRSLGSEFEQFCELKSFSYETRTYANEFFGFMRLKENKERWLQIFEGNDRRKVTFLEQIKMKAWFKSQWLTDTTVISSISVLDDLVTKIEVSKADEYYNQLKNDSVIYFDFLSESDRDAENAAATNYIRLNARGKQLDDFDNVKAILSMLENLLGKENKASEKFVYQYDQKYIDIFYKECSEEKNLEQKTKEINDMTLRLLINTYTLLRCMKPEKEDENSPLITCSDESARYHAYYSIIYAESKKDEISEFWVEYFEFINILLSTVVYDDGIKERMKPFWKQIYMAKPNDSGNLVSSLRYVYHYYKSQRQYSNINHLEQLDYVLLNLKYDGWKQVGFQTIELLAQYSTEYPDIFQYFAQETPNEVITMLKIHKDNCEINNLNDIKVRFKEQCIKANIISRLKENYLLFESLEKKSEKRQIQYLLSISDMWENDITEEKICDLLKYMEVAERFLCSRTHTERLLWRKLFAVASYWDAYNNHLLTADIIDQKISAKYESGKRNIHYWNDEYYFIYDDIERKNKEGDKLREEKHKLIKRAYEIWMNNGLSDEQRRKVWLKNQFADSTYETCWLKYAVDRDYEKLLDHTVLYDEVRRTVHIDIKHHYNNGFLWKCNFFSVIYSYDFLETHKDSGSCWSNEYYSYIWDYYGKPLYSHSSKTEGIHFDPNLKIINQFGLRLLWHGYKEQYLSYKITDGMEKRRSFFGYKYYIDFPDDPNSNISVIEGKVVITEFTQWNSYKQYEYDLKHSKEKCSIEIEEDIFKRKVGEFKSVEDAKSEEWHGRTYSYNNEIINKYWYKNSTGTRIEKNNVFTLENTQSIKCTHLLK